MDQNAAIDRAIGMLAAALHNERQERRQQRSEVLRSRLRESDKPALRTRVTATIDDTGKAA
jgi:hypothetical protein